MTDYSDTVLDMHNDTVRSLLALQKLSSPTGREAEFRASSLPFCPLRFLVDRHTPRTEQFTSDFYFKIGTAIHELFQRWMPLENSKYRPYGGWKCGKCRHEAAIGLMPATLCPKCKAEHSWRYQELTVNLFRLSGHIDMVLQSPGDDPVYMVRDFKTTTIDKDTKVSDYPIEANVHQVEAYCVALRKTYGLRVVAWQLIYVDRSNPIRSSKSFIPITRAWTEEKHRKTRTTLFIANKGYRVASRYLERRRPRDLTATARYRPCRSAEDFKTRMKAGFKYTDTGICPHLPVCSSRKTDEQVAAHFESTLASMTHED